MFGFFIAFVMFVCYLTYFYNEYELAECETERQALIASIEQLRKTSQRRKPRKTKKKG
ncbi:uncharacterized protein METZ01_LOCUS455382 [marine metagenome]|uniref:Uncharacterized protein n=1 Tax=marine metagenome TaxID=408172 RepID=A0A383A6A9_9ZZZZ